MPRSSHGSDGYGPPASEAVREAVAPFFQDDTPPPRDPKLTREIAARIEAREANIPWKRDK